MIALSPSVKADVSYDISAFGTLGYAISDESFNYLKYIDDEGTFAGESLFATQLDINLNSKWKAVIQAKIEADDSDESGLSTDLTWAFLSYRPVNDWLFRLGKLQVPGYLNSVNRDVGVTYDYIRLPAEFDVTSPVYNFVGAAITKTFLLDDSDIIVDLYGGRTEVDWRTYIGDDLSDGSYSTGAIYTDVSIDIVGLSLTYQTNENTYLAGIHRANIINDSNEWVEETGYVDLTAVGSTGFYSNDAAHGTKTKKSFDMYLANIGADIHLGHNIHLAAELALRKTNDITTGVNSLNGYVSLKKRMDKWTPYIVYARTKTLSDDLKGYNEINNNQITYNSFFSQLPEPITPSDVTDINAGQHIIADSYQAYDQYSIALGTSYKLSPTSVLKAEIMHVRVGNTSSLFDVATLDDASSDYNITTLAVSYSFAF